MTMGKLTATNSGYVGFSMSRRAAAAYANNDMPKTAFKKHYGISEKVFQQLLQDNEEAKKTWEDLVEESWHHTSMYCNKTFFYKLTLEGLQYLAPISAQAAQELELRTEELIEEAIDRVNEQLYPSQWAFNGFRSEVKPFEQESRDNRHWENYNQWYSFNICPTSKRFGQMDEFFNAVEAAFNS